MVAMMELTKGDIVYIPANTRGKKIINNKKTYFGEHTIKNSNFGYFLSEYKKSGKIYLYNIDLRSHWVVNKQDVCKEDNNETDKDN